MPKLGCVCGHTHNLTPVPDEGFVLVSDADFIDAPKSDWTLGSLYLCPDCRRILVIFPGEDEAREFSSYILEK